MIYWVESYQALSATMLISSQNVFTFSPSRFNLYYTTSIERSPSSRFSSSIASQCVKKFPCFQIPNHVLQFPLGLRSLGNRYRLGVFESEGSVQRESFGDFSLDRFLSIAEVFCLVSVAVISVGFAAKHALSDTKKTFPAIIGDRNLVFGILLLVCGVAIGSWIRRRQWRQISGRSGKSALEINLVQRIEKLEGDLRSSTILIRSLARHLEKLGIRFKLFRKAIKDPIAETAALAHKNSEATRALALQEETLEKELGEIQKVLLAMQEQQQKQLELVLAIGKMGRMLQSKQEVKNLKQKKTHRY